MKEVCAPALLADSGAGDALDGAPAEPARVLRELLLHRVGRERPEHRAVARAGSRGSRRGSVPRRTGGAERRRSSAVGQQPSRSGAAPRRGARPPRGCGAPRRSRRGPWRGPRSRCRRRAARTPNVIRSAPVSRSVPTVESEQAERASSRSRVGTEPRASTTANASPATISEKYSAGPKAAPARVSGTRAPATTSVATQPAKNEPMAAIAERRAGAALLRHLVAVERGDDRGHLARDVHQDRRGRAAVLRAVVDAGEHDERAGRLERRTSPAAAS